MAKIKHNNFLDTVNNVFTDAIDEGVLHLYAEGDHFSGRTIGVKNQNLFHFGTCKDACWCLELADSSILLIA